MCFRGMPVDGHGEAEVREISLLFEVANHQPDGFGKGLIALGLFKLQFLMFRSLVNF